MPDTYGWPTDQECLVKVAQAAPDGATEAHALVTPDIRKAVIAHFQSPVGRKGVGGTGRTFTPVTEFRFFDGTGYPELRVDDIVPGTSFECRAYDVYLKDVGLRQGQHGLGWNVLYRPQSAGAILATSYGLSGIFPLGKQNIRVNATWGFAEKVPDDVREAVACETAFRVLVQNDVGLEGVGDQVKMGPFEVDTAAGSSNWNASSPLPVFHRIYLDAIMAYRDTKVWKLARLAGRMS